MPRESAIPIDLPSLDDLFTTQAERDEVGCEKVGVIPLYMIDPFPDHPFRVDDDALRDMAESVSRFGVLVPALVRPKENGRYEMVSGHRRKRAAEMAGLEALPAVVREMTYDEAVIAMVDANIQRENVLPSEKAFAYKMKIDALSRQGYRSDLTCAPVGHKLANARSRDIVAEQSGESKSQVQRYVRLTHLNPDLLDMVDGGSMAMRPAVEISYLSEREQDDLLDAMGMEACTPSHAQAIRMRRLSEQGALSREAMASIMGERKPNQVEQFRIPREKIERFFKPGTSREAVEARIVKALELLERHERKRAASAEAHRQAKGDVRPDPAYVATRAFSGFPPPHTPPPSGDYQPKKGMATNLAGNKTSYRRETKTEGGSAGPPSVLEGGSQ